MQKNVTVKVVLHAPGSNPAFHFESTDLPIGPNNVLYFSNCQQGQHFMITYSLDDQANPGYRFPTGANSKKDALWVQQGTACPTQQCDWNVFEAQAVLQNGMALTVKNLNDAPQDFAYTLRVQKTGNWIELDPGGVNQNGGAPLYDNRTSYVLIALGSAIVGAFATYALFT